MTQTEATNILYRALETATSKWITNDPAKLRQKLYQTRTKLKREKGIADFDVLQFRISPQKPTEELWIINNLLFEEQQNG